MASKTQSGSAGAATTQSGGLTAAIAARPPHAVEVCIVMDTTGSMAGWIEKAKEGVKRVAERILEDVRKKFPSATVKFGFVSYKDFDDSGHLATHVLDSNFAKLEEMIATLRPSGGGDFCEDVAGALDAAVDDVMGWGARHKIVIHFLDAPPHGRDYHDLGSRGDDHLDVGTGLSDTLRRMAQNRISYTVVQCVENESKVHLVKFIQAAHAIYASEVQKMKTKTGKLPQFVPVEVSHDNHQQWFAIVLESTVKTVDSSIPSRTSVLGPAAARSSTKTGLPPIVEVSESDIPS